MQRVDLRLRHIELVVQRQALLLQVTKVLRLPQETTVAGSQYLAAVTLEQQVAVQ